MLANFQTQADPAAMPSPTKKLHKPQRNQFHFDLHAEHYRILGVDLTQVPGLETLSVHTLLSEVGPDLSAFPHEGEFSSWLGLCPNRRITGGRVLSSRTRKVRQRLAHACAWPRSRCTTASPVWANSTGVCAPNTALPKPSPSLPTSLLASFTIS